jgi:hypothetical protein
MFLVLAACGSEPTGDDDIEVRVDAARPVIDAPNLCGNGVCDPTETAASCQLDCGPRCGDGVCEGNEASTCPSDCQTCGNGVCEGNEPSTCPSDCTVCGNGVCEGNEASTCTSDCTARLVVRNQSSYTIWYLYLGACGGQWSNDQLGASTIPPGGQFTLSGIPPGCWYFRAETSASVNVRWTTPSGVQLSPGQAYTWTLVN